ncbi:IS481 family transposase [Hippea maritima]|uniref:Integrase catalytic region n=1 Tax=Hippea maritima (strain ATCC 700847 / DSM 10411 / MH2) TaxID=760142 RepID=F2LY84_HIPMA|nr:IS481 family transposase [Hippea maritima]AEA34407.1 Integrase catalytic region [Hippea maritima DSM 10411]
MDSIYHTLRKSNPASARILVRKVLEKNNGNVSKTARILGISRATVRRARDGELNDLSRRPKNIRKKIGCSLEKLIVEEAKSTGYRYRLLSYYLKNKYSIEISENTIKKVLKRNRVRKKKIRTLNKNRRHLYDYEHLTPFSHLQIDTKHILDETSLPKSVYRHIEKYDLPKYEWNAIDVKTRMRFAAYSHTLSASFGFAFILFVVLWLKLHNVRGKINIRLDNGSEFASSSRRKLDEYNEFFSKLNVELKPIPPGAKHLQAIVENSHRKDDESFFSIHPERCRNDAEFLLKAQQWQDTWNTARPHYGIDMNGLTPFEKLKSTKAMISENIVRFPTLLLEDIIRVAGYPYEWLSKFVNLYIFSRGGKYVWTTYQYLNHKL